LLIANARIAQDVVNKEAKRSALIDHKVDDSATADVLVAVDRAILVKNCSSAVDSINSDCISTRRRTSQNSFVEHLNLNKVNEWSDRNAQKINPKE